MLRVLPNWTMDLDKKLKKVILDIAAENNIDIFAVSMHRPSKWLLNNDLKLNKYVNTYEKRFFKDFKYLSDSRRQWREGCICNKIDVNKYDKLHILIHPFWWVKENVDFNKRIFNFIKEKNQKIDSDLSNNIDIYKKPSLKTEII